MSKCCGVYKITCLENGKIYIGSSKNIYNRWREHIRSLNNNEHHNIYLQNEWNLYGINKFKFEILKTCEEKDRFLLEQKFLNKYLPFNRNGKGYNIQEHSTYRQTSNIKIYKCKNNEDYYKVDVAGCLCSHYVEKEHCDNTSIDDLEWQCTFLDFMIPDENGKVDDNELKHWIF